MTQTVETIDTSRAAAMLKTALRAAFPAVKFSVRKDTGTAATWLRVTYADGPNASAVQEIAGWYSGERYNGQSDAYDQAPDQLLQFDGEDVPRLVRYAVSGVVVTRLMGPVGRAAVAARIAALDPEVQCLDPDGNLTRAALSPTVAEHLAGPRWAHGPATVRDIACPVFSALDLTT